jgi:dTDP-4-dehydrorhamnose 3,5-epimerase-like enzyme
MSTAHSTAPARRHPLSERRPEAAAVHRIEQTPLTGGGMLYELPRITDARGSLSFAEMYQALPFPVVRFFLVFGVPSREIRGEHAHRSLDEFLVCVHGNCSVRLFDGEEQEEVLLNRPDLGLHVPPMVWTTEYEYSADAVLLVLASELYREADYIRDLNEYLALRSEQTAGATAGKPYDAIS